MTGSVTQHQENFKRKELISSGHGDLEHDEKWFDLGIEAGSLYLSISIPFRNSDFRFKVENLEIHR